MASANEVRVSYIGDIRDLTAQLKSVTGITSSEARAQVAAVVAGQKAQAAAIKETTTAANQAAAASKNMADEIGEGGGNMDAAGKAAVKLRGALGAISPEAAGLAGGVDDAVDALEGLEVVAAATGISMSVMLVVVAPVAVAFVALIGVMDDYTASSKAAKAAHDGLAAAMVPMGDAIKAAKAEQELLNAALSSGDSKRYLAVAGLSAAADRKEAESTAALRAEKETLLETLAMTADWGTLDALIAQNRIQAIDKDIRAVHAQANKLAALSVQNFTLRGAIEGAKDATVVHATATADTTAELMKEAHAAQAVADAFEAKLAGLEKQESEANAMIAASGAFRLSEIERLQFAEDQAAAAYLNKHGSTGAGVATIRANYEDQITAVMHEESLKRIAISEAESAATRDASEKAKEQRIADQQAVGSAIIGLGNDLIAATTKQYDTTTAAGREAAIKQFNTQKAANLAMAVIAGALAIQQALGSGPPPANFILAGISGAAAAIELGVIATAQPKFHSGTTGFRPDEASAILQRGEGVVTAAGMAQPGMMAAVREANGGGSPMSRDRPAGVTYLHKGYNRFIRDNLKQSSPLARRIDRGSKVGHRSRRNK